MQDWLYEKVQRVPKISNKQVAAMRHIEPVLRNEKNGTFRRIEGVEKIDPRNASFLWDAKPTGREFTFHMLNQTTIVTQHHSSVFFKPSLAEVYAWLLVYMPNDWRRVTHFCMGEHRRIGCSTDVACECVVMGGKILVLGKEFVACDGSVGHQLVAANAAEGE